MIPRTLRLDSLDFRVARASSPESLAGAGFSEDCEESEVVLWRFTSSLRLITD